MDDLVARIQAQARAHPSNPVLRRVLADFHYILNAALNESPEPESRYAQLQQDLDVLATEGLWKPSKEDEDSLKALRKQLGLSGHGHHAIEDSSSDVSRTSTPDTSVHGDSLASTTSGARDVPIVQPPPSSIPSLPVSTLNSTVLPVELVQTLNHVFFLHLLSTDPSRVLPPGKSLLSMMSAPRSNFQDGDLPKLEDRVKDIVHRVFWKEVLDTLSDPSPAKQLPRLRLLYQDLLAAVKPLLPRTHPILATLSFPLSPTSAPLRSALGHLRELLVALRGRCSPLRDPHIDNLITTIDGVQDRAAADDLARQVAETTRAILDLAEAMKDDLSQFVLGSTDERDLKVIITQQAMLREKALILGLWLPSRIEPAWKTWVAGIDGTAYPGLDAIHPPHHRWTLRLVQALGSNSPVSCPIPSPAPSTGATQEEEPPNMLPPPFFVTCPSLLAAQNYLQALVITASLRSLVRIPPGPPSSTHPGEEVPAASFTERIWTLLKASVDEDPGAGDTKIANLADEVIRVRRGCADPAHPCGAEEEARLRAAVDRTLQPHDPVFGLLHKRLLQGLATWLTNPTHVASDGGASSSRSRTSTPVHMQTGREPPGKRPRLHLGLENPKSVFVGWERERGRPMVVKGFEDEVLVREVRETFRKVGVVVDWTDRVWQDLVETGEVGGPSEKAEKEEKEKFGEVAGSTAKAG